MKSKVPNLGTLLFHLCALSLSAAVLRAEEPLAAKNPEPGDRVMVLLKEGNKALSGVLVTVSEKAVTIQTSVKTEEIGREQIQFMRSLETKAKPAGAVEDEDDPPHGRTARTQAPRPGSARPNGALPADESPQEGSRLLELLKGGAQRAAEKPPAAAAEVKDLKVQDAFAQAAQWFELLQHGLAGQALRKIVSSGQVEEVKRAEAGAQERFKRPLADVLVLCYAKAKCRTCSGDGLLECKACTGQGYTARMVTLAIQDQGNIRAGTRERGDLTGGGFREAAGDKSYHRITLCGTCRGHGYEPCPACRGTGAEFAKPSPYERERYADYLVALGDGCLITSESTFGDTQRDAPQELYPRNGAMLKSMLQQVWLRDSIGKVKSDVMRLLRAKTYYEEAMKADPGLSLRNYTKDYDQLNLKIVLRATHLLGELNERYQVYAQNRTERALDEAYYVNDPKIQRTDARKILGDE